MKKVLILAAALLVFSGQVSAQPPLTYDLFYGLPGEAGSMGADVGILNSDISSIGDATDVPVMIKKSLNDNLEVGARATLGFLHEGASSFESLVVGGKYKLGENNALSVGVLLPLGGSDKPGLAVGYMMSMEAAGLMWNNQLHLGLLDGHTNPADKNATTTVADSSSGGMSSPQTGILVDILLEPYKELNDKMVGYLDILIGTNTDDIGGDPLGINLGPNLDYILSEGLAVNIGITIGIAGDEKAGDPGIGIVLLKSM